jgi:hypothetical protein
VSKTVPEFLADAAELYKKRNAVYKDNYKRVGPMYVQLFPEGITLKTADDFNKFAIFMQMVNKFTRCASNFQHGHQDSVDDLAVYAMMLKELDSGSGMDDE